MTVPPGNALDFIATYADYADVLECPRALHQMVAIQLVATALNRNGVLIPLGPLRHTLDLWTLLLSGSGEGRSTTVGLVAPILEAARMQDLESAVVWGSASSFYQHYAESPAGLLIWGEMAELLKLINNPRFAGVKEWLTDRYDNPKIPPPFRYRRTGKKQDTPPIEFGQAPRINILATSSDDWFFRNLAETDSAGGFLARWVIVRAGESSRDVPVPQAPNASLIPSLANRLQEVGKLTGQADLSDVLPAYEGWYSETKRRFQAQPNAALAKVYFNRHRIHILKLAVVFEASRTGRLRVSREAWERAVEFARRAEGTIFELLPTGMSAVGFDLQRIEGRIKQAGPRGLTQNELTRSFQSMKRYDREQAIQTLVDGGTVLRCSRSTPGRSTTVYVHESFPKPIQVESSSQSVAATSAREQRQEDHRSVAACAGDANAHD